MTRYDDQWRRKASEVFKLFGIDMNKGLTALSGEEAEAALEALGPAVSCFLSCVSDDCADDWLSTIVGVRGDREKFIRRITTQ